MHRHIPDRCSRALRWGRDAALWLGRRQGRLGLAQLGKLVGGVDYAAVAQGISRFEKRLKKDPAMQKRIERLQGDLSIIETPEPYRAVA